MDLAWVLIADVRWVACRIARERAVLGGPNQLERTDIRSVELVCKPKNAPHDRMRKRPNQQWHVRDALKQRAIGRGSRGRETGGHIIEYSVCGRGRKSHHEHLGEIALRQADGVGKGR